MRGQKDDIPRLIQRNGVYTIAWTDAAVKDARGRTVKPARTQRIGLRTRDPETAQARYAAFLVQGKDSFGRVGSSILSVAQALDDYYREHVAKKVVDKVRQETAIRHLKEFFGGLPLVEIDIPKCRGYLDARRNGVVGGGMFRRGDYRKGADSTIRREMIVLRAAAFHAARWKRVGPAATPCTPMPTFELPSLASYDNAGVAWIDREGIETLLRGSTGRLHHFIALAYHWAARRGWVERLRVEQIDLRNGRVQPYQSGEPVTGKRRVIMPIFPEIRPNVEHLVRHATDGWLFGPRARFYDSFRALCELAGFEDRAYPHVLRHSRATHLLMDGVSIYKVARLLGDTVMTVERTYGHHSVEYLQELKDWRR